MFEQKLQRDKQNVPNPKPWTCIIIWIDQTVWCAEFYIKISGHVWNTMVQKHMEITDITHVISGMQIRDLAPCGRIGCMSTHHVYK